MSEITLSEQVSGSPVDLLSPIDPITTFASDHPADTTIICVSALVVLVLAYFTVRAAYRAVSRTVRRFAENRPAEDVLTIVAAAIATGVSAQGMWKFSGDVLGFSGPLRLLLFAFIEVAVITSAVRARRNMRENFSAGIDGMAVWALTSLSAVLSSLDADSLPGAIFRLAAPLVAAWLWERGMAIERHRITGRARINWRISPERIAVFLGLAEAKNRTADEVDTERRLTRVALAAKLAHEHREAGASDRKLRAALRKLEKAFAAAEEHVGLASDEAKQQKLKAKVAALYSASRLLDVEAESAWTDNTDDAPSEPAGVHLINAGLAKWSQEMLREPAEMVARRDLLRDQDATGIATIIPAPRRRIMGAPGSPWPIGRLVPFIEWTRPESRPPDERFPLPPLDTKQDGKKDGATDADNSQDAGGSRPNSDQDGDQREPTEQDRRRVARWWVKRYKAGEKLSKWKLAERTGFKPTWCGDRIAEGKEILLADGWILDARGELVPPPVLVAGQDASTLRPQDREPSLNGSAPTVS